MITVVEGGPHLTLQDGGRPGRARMGVGVGGAADRASWALGNRLVGNQAGAAALESAWGAAAVRFEADHLVVLTGAAGPATLDDTPVGRNAAIFARSGQTLRVGIPTAGIYTYLAVRGGLTGTAIYGSVATDVLSGLGPPPLVAGDTIPVGAAWDGWPAIDYAPVPDPRIDDITARVRWGPRDDWFTAEARHLLLHTRWEVTSLSNRVGLRLSGPALPRRIPGELPSEGVVRGAIQVSSSGQPILFSADHPVTGGYPVIAVVAASDHSRIAQLRPGQGLLLAAPGS